jgi:putative membrane protein
MTQEALLAYAHILAIFTMIVFLTSEAALCRAEWMNAKIVERLATLDMVYGISAVAVLATGLARVFFGVKGSAWYWGNWLLYTKLGLFIAVALLSIPPTIAFIRWRRALRADGSLPAPAEVARVRKLVMTQAHIIPIVPIAAVFLARGYGG